MEAFQLLSRGGVHFDKKRFQNDVQLFNKRAKVHNTGNQRQEPLPSELDFFKYAQGKAEKRRSHDAGIVTEWKGREISDAGKDAELLPEKRHSVERNVSLATISHKVVAKGSEIPGHADTFEELHECHNIPSQIWGNLQKLGYVQPTSVQSYCIPILLKSRDLAAISPTGTGKTLSYVLPVLANLGTPMASRKDESEKNTGVRAVVIAPTRELAHQIHNEFLKLADGRKWRIILFNKATASTLANKEVRDKVDIIVSTPLRLISSLQSGNIELNNVHYLVLDEADRLLDSEFLSQTEEIVAACTHPDINKAVFSATLPAGAEALAMQMLRDPIRVVVGLKDTPLPLISQSLTYVADDASKLPSILAYLSQPYHPPILIFMSSQPRATSLAEELVLNGIPNVDCLHAAMSKKEREDATSRMRKGECWVMISTEVMARGMDFKGVREVINYDFPPSVQSYIHRIGRTGRAGREGKAVTYFTDEDAPHLKSLANVILQSGFHVPEWITKLPKPSKMIRKAMGKVKRSEIINSSREIGRRDARKKRQMIEASKRRKNKSMTDLSDRISQDET